jgi:hypothetical protein
LEANSLQLFFSPKIAPCRLLVDAQSKPGRNGNDIIKKIGLQALKRSPFRFICESIHFQRDALFRGRQLPHDLGHVLTNLGMVFDIVR